MSESNAGMDDFEQPWTLAGEVRRLRFDMGQMREWKAAQEINQGHLTANVTRLTAAVEALQTAIDRSRGALYVVTGLSGAIGAGAAAIVTLLLHRPPGP
jgi:outer membrane murein-binding lipoprotein Lpp